MPDPTVRAFLVPDLGEGLLEATVVEWHVTPGETVALNQRLCTLETEKAEVEIPSPFAGTVTECRGAPGDTLLVGTTLAQISVAGGDTSPTEAASPGTDSSGTPSPDTPSPHTPSMETGTTREPVLVGYGTDETQRTGRRRQLPNLKAGAAVAPNHHPAPPEPGITVDADTAARPLAKPPVRHLARSLGVDLATLAPGSGPNGIITRDDVNRATAGAAPDVSPAGPAVTMPEDTDDEFISVVGIRARITERMTTARRKIPDASCSVEVDFTRLLELRKRIVARADTEPDAASVTPFSLVCSLVVRVLGQHRILNSTFLEDGPAIRCFASVHLGIGTATDRGLVVPVIHHADRLSTVALAKRTSELAAAARAGSLAPKELVGSTFTISNFGGLGLDAGDPIINYPEAAILGMGSVRPRPIVIDGEVVARPTGYLTLVFDHRVCDGVEAATFLRALAALIEDPSPLDS